MFVTFLPFKMILYVVLPHGKGPNNSMQGDFFKTKNTNKKPPDPNLHFTCLTACR